MRFQALHQNICLALVYPIYIGYIISSDFLFTIMLLAICAEIFNSYK